MDIAQILGLMGQYGAAGIFAVLWWLERDERKKSQEVNGVMFERALTALVENKNTIQTLKDIFNGGRAA